MKKLSKVSKIIIGSLFFLSGIFQVITKHYSDVSIIMLSVFSFGYWIFIEE